MTCRWLLLILAITLLCLGLLRAEEWTYKQDVPVSPNVAESTNSDKMYEDIEIFRRILDRKLHPLYPAPFFPRMMGMQGMGHDGGAGGFGGMGGITGLGGGGFNQLGAQGSFQGNFQGGGIGGIAGLGGAGANFQGPSINTNAVWDHTLTPTLEGVYLKGQGIVYTATLTSLQPPSKETKIETTKPVSEWESVRRQLRNEKEEPKKVEASKPSTLSDVLLKVLAENGHHFSQLGENESLTLVLTVREASSHYTVYLRSAQNLTQTKPQSTDAGKVDFSFSEKVRDLELLGDLHMKQEHYVMARDAFRKAVEMKPSPEQSAVLARKLAQASLMLGKIEEARRALDQATAFMKEATDAKDKPASTSKPAAVLPVKLIVSAPKKLLDEVKEGKITFEEFRGKARVETLLFGASRSHK